MGQSSVYRKLGRMPVEVSQALLRACTARLHDLVPSARRGTLPDH